MENDLRSISDKEILAMWSRWERIKFEFVYRDGFKKGLTWGLVICVEIILISFESVLSLIGKIILALLMFSAVIIGHSIYARIDDDSYNEAKRKFGSNPSDEELRDEIHRRYDINII